MLQEIRHQVLAICWALLTVVLCLFRPPSIEEEITLFEGFDKLAHTGFFFVLSVLLFYGKIRHQKTYSYRFLTILKILLIGGFIGGGIELAQYYFTDYRSADWWDFFADMLGVSMGIFSYVFLHRFRFHEKMV